MKEILSLSLQLIDLKCKVGTGASSSVAMMIEVEELTLVVLIQVSCGLKTTKGIFFQFIQMERLITRSRKLMSIICKLRKS